MQIKILRNEESKSVRYDVQRSAGRSRYPLRIAANHRLSRSRHGADWSGGATLALGLT
jgi:hypothetical protein